MDTAVVTQRGPESHHQNGFTLLELLVALAVFAIMAVAAYSGLQSVLFAYATAEAQAQRLAQLQMAFHILERDMEQVANRGIRDEYGQKRPSLAGGDLGDTLIIFTRAGWDNPLGHQRSTLQRLSYRLEEESLVRSYWEILDRGGLNNPREAMLLDNVRDISMNFLDTRNNWQSKWPPSAASEDSISLPRAVEISVTLNDWGAITRLYRLPTL